MIALTGIGGDFHLAEKGIHLRIIQVPSGAYRSVAGNGRQHMGQSVLQCPAAAELDKFLGDVTDHAGRIRRTEKRRHPAHENASLAKFLDLES